MDKLDSLMRKMGHGEFTFDVFKAAYDADPKLKELVKEVMVEENEYQAFFAKALEKAGKGIRGGTAVGKNYSTLVLDLDYKQQGEIRIDCDEETIELYDEPVYDFKSFQRVYIDGKEGNLEEATNGKQFSSIVEKVISQIKEDRPGLWANIHAQRERGEKPARKGSKDYKAAVKAGKKINAMTEAEEAEKSRPVLEARRLMRPYACRRTPISPISVTSLG